MSRRVRSKSAGASPRRSQARPSAAHAPEIPPDGPAKAAKIQRKGPRRRAPAPRAGLMVRLSTRLADGQTVDGKQVELTGAIRRAKQKAAGPAVRVPRRKSAARQIARGIRPENVARLLAALAHPQRVRILLTLLDGEATHKKLARTTKLKAGPLYHHLRELRMAGLIGPKTRDLYTLTPAGGRAILAGLAMERLCR